MKKTLLLFFFLQVSLFLFAQEINIKTMTHDELEREYIEYIPASYDGSVAVPVLFNLHGYTSNASEQMFYGDFKPQSNEYGFILIHPYGLLDGEGVTHWNAGWGTGIDDVGFINAMIDQLAIDYNIDLTRVYSTGMSNGGFMSYHLACELSDKIAAIASVTGTMNVGQLTTCIPSHQMPVMEIHGTNDATVPYDGNGTFMESIPNVIDHWVAFNNCNSEADFTTLPNVSTIDGSTAEHYVYSDGDNGATVELYKIINGAHTWPSGGLIFPGTNLDFSASEKIWEFFNKYDINGLRNTTNNENIVDEKAFDLFPNPANNIVNVSWNNQTIQQIKVLNIIGKEILQQDVNGQLNTSLSISDLYKGMYLVQAINNDNEIVGTYKLVKE